MLDLTVPIKSLGGPTMNDLSSVERGAQFECATVRNGPHIVRSDDAFRHDARLLVSETTVTVVIVPGMPTMYAVRIKNSIFELQ